MDGVGGRQLQACRVLVPSWLGAGGIQLNRTMALGRTSPPTPASSGDHPWAAPRPPAARHEGEHGRENTHLGGSQGPSPAASCQSDPPPSITSFFGETECFCWL